MNSPTLQVIQPPVRFVYDKNDNLSSGFIHRADLASILTAVSLALDNDGREVIAIIAIAAGLRVKQ